MTHDLSPLPASVREFHLLGLAITPPLVVLCTVVLWAWTSLIW